VGQAIEHFVACGTLQAARASDGIFSLSAEFKDPTVARGNTCWTCNEVIAVTGTLVPTYRPAFSNVRFTWPKTGYRDNWLFITPGWDLQEGRCPKCRLYRQVNSAHLSVSDSAILQQMT
jgi:hypothetical protein